MEGLADLSKEIESAARDFREAAEDTKEKVLESIKDSMKKFDNLDLVEGEGMSEIKKFGKVVFQINEETNALEMKLPNGDTMPLDEFNRKMFGETESPEEGESSAKKPEPVEVLKTFFDDVPSDEALSVASEPYVENWKSRSEPIETENSVRRDAQKVADTSDAADAEQAGKEGRPTDTPFDDDNAQIEQETQQYPDEVNEIQKASKDLREAYDERNKATTDAERKAADEKIRDAQERIKNASEKFNKVTDAKGNSWCPTLGSILGFGILAAGGIIGAEWYANGVARSRFESGCWLQYNGPSTRKPIRWKIANMTCDPDYISVYISCLSSLDSADPKYDPNIIHAGVIDGSVIQGNLNDIYTGTFCGVDVNSKAAEDIQKAQQCWFNDACYKNITDKDCLNGKTYPNVLFNPCLMDQGVRDASGISSWKSDISTDVNNACLNLFTDDSGDVKSPELPDPQGCVNYKVDGQNAVQLCTNSLTNSNCDQAKEAGDLENDIDVKKCDSKMFNLAPGFTIFHVYMSPIEGAATNTMETLNGLLDDFGDLIKSILKFLLYIGLPILGGILLVFILIKVVPSLLKKKKKQEITINVKGAQKFNYF